MSHIYCFGRRSTVGYMTYMTVSTLGIRVTVNANYSLYDNINHWA